VRLALPAGTRTVKQEGIANFNLEFVELLRNPAPGGGNGRNYSAPFRIHRIANASS
jgi:hypothetical protein